jgi:SH3-like domain-containing protein
MASRVSIIRPYAAQYPQPIAFAAGDRVSVHHADTEYIGWHWCRNAAGVEGWVHESYLSGTQGDATAVRSYSAEELTVVEGDQGTVLDQLGGWLYLELDDARKGWVPEAHTLRIS